MAAAWPDGVPYRIKRQGAGHTRAERSTRSSTDSGLARQRAVFRAAPRSFTGVIRMSLAEMALFDAWYEALGGAVFTLPKHPLKAGSVDCRFIAGQMGPAQPDSATPKWIVPVAIEILPSSS